MKEFKNGDVALVKRTMYDLPCLLLTKDKHIRYTLFHGMKGVVRRINSGGCGFEFLDKGNVLYVYLYNDEII